MLARTASKNFSDMRLSSCSCRSAVSPISREHVSVVAAAVASAIERGPTVNRRSAVRLA